MPELTTANRAADLLSAVFVAALDAIIMLDVRGTILEFNPSAERLFGFTRDEAIGREMARLIIPERAREAHRRGLARYLETGDAPVLSKRLVLSATRRDGLEFPVELAVSLVQGTERPVFIGFVRDLSEHRRLTRQAERRRHALEKVVQLTTAISRSLSPLEVAAEVARCARELFGVPVAEVFELDAESGDARCIASDADSGHPLGLNWVIPCGEAAVGLAARERTWVTTADVLHDPRIPLSPEVRTQLEQSAFRAVMAGPLVADGQLVGVLTLRRLEAPTFDAEALSLVQSLAHFAAVALHKARLYRRVEARRRAGEMLIDLEHFILDSLDYAAIARQIVVHTRAHLEVPAADLLSIEEGSDRLVSSATPTAGEHPYGWNLVLSPGSGVSGLAFRDLMVVASSDVVADPRITYSPEEQAQMARTPYRALLAAPLIGHGRVMGVLLVGDRAGRRFTDEDRRLTEILASHAALALERARLLADSERRRNEAELFAQLASSIATTLDLDSTLEQVAHGAAQICRADLARIALRDPMSDGMVFRNVAQGSELARVQIESGKGCGGIVMATGQPFRTDSYVEDPCISTHYRDVVRSEGVMSLLVVPIRIDGRVDGLVYVANRERRPFSDHDEATLMRLAGHAALAIANARLFAREAESRAAAAAALGALRESMDRLAILRELDQAILAADSPRSLALTALRHARRLVPCLRASVTLFDLAAGEACVLAVDTDTATAPEEGACVPLAPFWNLADLEAGRICVVDDLAALGSCPDARALIDAGGRAGMSVPLLVSTQLIGALNILFNGPVPFPEEHAETLHEVAGSLAVGLEQARLREEFLAGQERLRLLSRRVVQVQEAERRQLARELHDEIGGILTGLKVTLASAAQSLGSPIKGGSKGRRSVRDLIQGGLAIVTDLIARVRDLSLRLRPGLLDDLGLVPTLLWHFERFTSQTGVRVEFRHAPLEERRFPLEIETTAYRIVQEALTNVARHSVARSATVRLWVTDASLGVQIEDQGVGFDPHEERLRPTSEGIGLEGMRERALSLDGHLEIESTPGCGVRVTVELPFDGGARSPRSAE